MAVEIGEYPAADLEPSWYFKAVWRELFPNVTLPDKVGVSYGGGFATTADAIRRRPKRDYEEYLQWLADRWFPGDLGGRVFGYMWHSEFWLVCLLG